MSVHTLRDRHSGGQGTGGGKPAVVHHAKMSGRIPSMLRCPDGRGQVAVGAGRIMRTPASWRVGQYCAGCGRAGEVRDQGMEAPNLLHLWEVKSRCYRASIR
jgi:hypothetical protein